MTLLQSVEQQLSGLSPAPFNFIGAAMALAAVINTPPQVGVSGWVVPLLEVPSRDSRSAGPSLQRVEVTFGVILAIRVVNDRHGSKGSDVLDSARTAVREKLYGWQPQGALVPCLLGSSELINMENATIWWMDRYTTAIQRRANQI